MKTATKDAIGQIVGGIAGLAFIAWAGLMWGWLGAVPAALLVLCLGVAIPEMLDRAREREALHEAWKELREREQRQRELDK